ncbi:MAG: type II toxin-antitoxin system VapC family toxin [Verrucomicrobia bacterium]|nr:type II toxin-antitoxin system VapC family toxin [Verrucomicrobiota bacterium]
MSWLLDTNVISESHQRTPNRRVMDWLDAQPESELFLSAITLGELQSGAARLPEGPKRRSLLTWINNDLRQRFAGRILPVDERVGLAWGNLTAASHRQPLRSVDSLIAAAALSHGLTLATRNTAEMARTGVSLFNPWEE